MLGKSFRAGKNYCVPLIHHQGIIFPPRRDFADLKPRCLRFFLRAPVGGMCRRKDLKAALEVQTISSDFWRVTGIRLNNAYITK
jgi:hypothetical protein